MVLPGCYLVDKVLKVEWITGAKGSPETNGWKVQSSEPTDQIGNLKAWAHEKHWDVAEWKPPGRWRRKRKDEPESSEEEEEEEELVEGERS